MSRKKSALEMSLVNNDIELVNQFSQKLCLLRLKTRRLENGIFVVFYSLYCTVV